ncbi:MAG: hypothetical protein H0T43_04360, partial [Solirubrobacterales bacterium]|nr:hypothetical protein [Solirubrobacterales bacterium]
MPPPAAAARRRVLHRRAVPIAALGALAFGAGIVMGTAGRPAEERLVERFVTAWERGDFATMHAQLTDADRRERTATEFARAYREAQQTATATSEGVRAGPVGSLQDGRVD